jgi:hypothetical protein
MPCHLEPQQLSPAVTQNQERKQEIKGQCRHNAHIDGGDGLSLVSHKCLPGLRRRVPASRHIFRDRRLGDFEAEHQQLAMDPGCAPKWVFPYSSAGSDRAGHDQSSAALPYDAISNAKTF